MLRRANFTRRIRARFATRAVRGLDLATVIALTAATVYLGLNAGGYFAGDTGGSARFSWSSWQLASHSRVRSRCLPNRLTAIALGRHGRVFPMDARVGGVVRRLGHFDHRVRPLPALPGHAWRCSHRWRGLSSRFASPRMRSPSRSSLSARSGSRPESSPGLWPVEPPADEGKLGYPLTYSNALGAMAAIGVIVCAHLASWSRGAGARPRGPAGALPILAATLALTFSDGALVAGGVGLVLYLVLGFQPARSRPRLRRYRSPPLRRTLPPARRSCCRGRRGRQRRWRKGMMSR